eukprot:6919782-Pyramimonas_sp.AAC.1
MRTRLPLQECPRSGARLAAAQPLQNTLTACIAQRPRWGRRSFSPLPANEPNTQDAAGATLEEQQIEAGHTLPGNDDVAAEFARGGDYIFDTRHGYIRADALVPAGTQPQDVTIEVQDSPPQDAAL